MDEAYETHSNNFKLLIDEVVSDKVRNEAQTRFDLIDTMLTDCLGWERHKDVHVEKRTSEGYADYILSTSRNVIVFEAKKEADFFEVPKTTKPSLISIKNLIGKDNLNLESAMNQAKSYAQDQGISIAVITNGLQYIAFLASRSDGVPPMDGMAAVFTDIDQINEHFTTFWNYFSKDGMLLNNLTNILLKKANQDPPIKPATLIDDYPGAYTRNSLQADMLVLSELVLEDLTYGELEEAFIEHCYCETGAMSQYSTLARNIIKSRYEQVEDTTNVQIESVSDKRGLKSDFLEASASRRPVILIGDVGVGKTSFIRNLIASKDSIFQQNDIALHINLGENAILSDSINTGTLTKIKDLLLIEHSVDIYEDDFVRTVYAEDLNRLKKSIYRNLSDDKYTDKELELLAGLTENNAEHVKKSLNHLVKRGSNKHAIKVALFLDNADQRSSLDQQAIFLVAHELSSQTLASVFVSIRPETFYLSHKEGVLKAYHPKVYTIEPPRIDLVLQRRIEFALMISKGEIEAPGLQNTVKLGNLTVMLEVMLRTLQSPREEQKRLMAMIDDMVAGNVRMAVDMIKQFLSSGHTNIGKILDIEESHPGTYYIPLHEFLKSMIYGNDKYYNPRSSLVSNLYNIRTKDPKEYFLNLILIDRLTKLGNTKIAKQGFVSSSEIYNQLQALGYLPEQIEKSIVYLIEEGMAENPVNTELDDSVHALNSVRVTTKGSVYIKLTVGTFQYVDSMLVDIPIIDKHLLEEINNTFRTYDLTIEERLIRSEQFVSYLSDIYKDKLVQYEDTEVDNLIQSLFAQYRSSIQAARLSYQRSEMNNRRKYGIQ